MQNMNRTTAFSSRRNTLGRQLLLAAGSAAMMLAINGAAMGQAADATAPANPPAAKATIVTSGVDADGRIHLVVNRTALLATRAPVTRVSVGQPEIADVNVLGSNNILVTAKKPGSTQIIVWDDANHSQAIDVVVETDLAALQEQVKQMFPGLQIT